jgi:hypothetical protein
LGILNAALTLGLALADGNPEDLVFGVMWCVIIVGGPTWYLYRKAAVVSYFGAVAERSGAP